MPLPSWLRLLLTPPTRADVPFFAALLLAAVVVGVSLVVIPAERFLAVAPWVIRVGPLVMIIGAAWEARGQRQIALMVKDDAPAAATVLRLRASRLDTIALITSAIIALPQLWLSMPAATIGVMSVLGGFRVFADRLRERAWRESNYGAVIGVLEHEAAAAQQV